MSCSAPQPAQICYGYLPHMRKHAHADSRSDDRHTLYTGVQCQHVLPPLSSSMLCDTCTMRASSEGKGAVGSDVRLVLAFGRGEPCYDAEDDDED